MCFALIDNEIYIVYRKFYDSEYREIEAICTTREAVLELLKRYGEDESYQPFWLDVKSRLLNFSFRYGKLMEKNNV